MAKSYRIPDFRKMYPEASEEVIAVLKQTERKMLYQEYDLKVERMIVNHKSCKLEKIPSREDSYERLLEKNVQFCGEIDSAEEQALKNIQIQQLHKALLLLSDDERELIDRIFFRGQTEREIAAAYGSPRSTVNKRRKRVLEKLRNLLKKF